MAKKWIFPALFILIFIISVWGYEVTDNTFSNFTKGIYVEINPDYKTNITSGTWPYVKISNSSGSIESSGLYLSSVFWNGTTANDITSVLWNNISWVSDYNGTAPAGQEHPARSSMAGYWKFNGDALDSSGNGNDGSVNGASNSTECIFGTENCSFSFDGSDDYISVSDSSSLHLTTEVSLEAWVNVSAIGATQFVISKEWSSYESGWDAFSISIGSDGAIWTDISDGWSGEGGGNHYVYAYSTETIGSGVWHHIAATWQYSLGDYRDFKIYIDGSPATMNAGPQVGSVSNIGTTSGPLYFGKLYATSYQFGGKIDHAIIYSKSLTAEEVRESYARGARDLNISMRYRLTNETDEVYNTSGLAGFWKLQRDNNFELSNTSNLLGFWKLNNDSAYGENDTLAYDYSGNGNNGTISGATFTASGYFNGSYNFDGTDDCVDLGTDASLQPTTGLTVEAWVKRAGNGDSGFNGIVTTVTNSGVSGGQNGYALVYYPTSKTVRFYIDESGGGSWAYAETNGDLDAGTWYYLTATWNGTTITLYVNGVSQTTTGTAASITYSSSQTSIGRYRDGSDWSYGFKGIIDGVAIYNRTLSAEEIYTNYINASGTYDYSGNNNNGTAYTSSPPNETGYFNGSYSFDGTDDIITISGLDYFSSAEPHTYETWIYLRSTPGGNTYSWVIGNGGETTGDSLLIYDDGGGTSYFSLIYQGGYYRVDSASQIPLDTWTYVAVTYDGVNEVKFYMNGALDATRTTSASWSGGSGQSSLGAWKRESNPSAYFLNGTLDSVRIYNRTLPAEEIRYNYYHANFTSREIEANSSEMAGYWKLNGNADDETENNNDGSVTGAVATTTCKMGSGNCSYYFDGNNDKIDVGNGSSLALTNFTIEAWIKPEDASKFRSWVFGHRDTTAGEGGSYDLVLWDSNSGANHKAYCQLNDGVSYYGGSGTATIPEDTWTHVVCTNDNSNINIYVNGNLDGTYASSASFSAVSRNSEIGYQDGFDGNGFKGEIDQVIVYNRTLTADEAYDRYKAGDGFYQNSPTSPLTINKNAKYLQYEAQLETNDTVYTPFLEKVTAGYSAGYEEEVIAASLPISGVNFGSLNLSQSDDTSDNNPPPLVIQNDGNVPINVKISATDLWSSRPNPSGYYQFFSAENESGCVPNPGTDLVNSWTNMSSDTVYVAQNLKWENSSDAVNVHLKVTVPDDEPAGSKSSVITFVVEKA